MGNKCGRKQHPGTGIQDICSVETAYIKWSQYDSYTEHMFIMKEVCSEPTQGTSVRDEN